MSGGTDKEVWWGADSCQSLVTRGIHSTVLSNFLYLRKQKLTTTTTTKAFLDPHPTYFIPLVSFIAELLERTLYITHLYFRIFHSIQPVHLGSTPPVYCKYLCGGHHWSPSCHIWWFILFSHVTLLSATFDIIGHLFFLGNFFSLADVNSHFLFFLHLTGYSSLSWPLAIGKPPGTSLSSFSG